MASRLIRRTVGPAWIYPPDGGEEPVRSGEWITRADAEAIAAEHGYDLTLDDSGARARERDQPVDLAKVGQRVDVVVGRDPLWFAQ